MKYFYNLTIAVALASMSSVVMADNNFTTDSKSPALMTSLSAGFAHEISDKNAKDIRGGYRRCHNSIPGVCVNIKRYSYSGTAYSQYSYNYWYLGTGRDSGGQYYVRR